MSNTFEEKKESDNVLQEVSNKVTIEVEDCSGAAEFWKHFNIDMIPELKEAFAKFEKDPTFANQQEIKLQICRAIGFTEHDAFYDEMFKDVAEECRGVVYDMSFDKSLESTLEQEDKKQS